MEILSVRDLTFGYPDCPVLEHFSCAFAQGRIVRLEGKNGAGKTTLLKCLTALVNQGKCVFYKGKEIFQSKELLSELSYVMSEDTLYDYLTIEENVAFYRGLFGAGGEFSDEVFRILRELDCEQYRGFLVKNLSQGTRSKIYMAICLAKNAEIYLLDEPFTALDLFSQNYFRAYIQKLNQEKQKTVILVTHIEDFKTIASETIVLEKREV